MRRTMRFLAVPLVVCVAGAIMGIAAHQSDPLFAFHQRNLTRLSTDAVDALVRTAPDPRDRRRVDGVARCRPEGRDDLRNPWSCVITYSHGLKTRYLVTIRGDGSYVGRDLEGGGGISGCCTRVTS